MYAFCIMLKQLSQINYLLFFYYRNMDWSYVSVESIQSCCSECCLVEVCLPECILFLLERVALAFPLCLFGTSIYLQRLVFDFTGTFKCFVIQSLSLSTTAETPLELSICRSDHFFWSELSLSTGLAHLMEGVLGYANLVLIGWSEMEKRTQRVEFVMQASCY